MTVGDGTLIVPPQPEIMIESRVPMFSLASPVAWKRFGNWFVICEYPSVEKVSLLSCFCRKTLSSKYKYTDTRYQFLACYKQLWAFHYIYTPLPHDDRHLARTFRRLVTFPFVLSIFSSSFRSIRCTAAPRSPPTLFAFVVVLRSASTFLSRFPFLFDYPLRQRLAILLTFFGRVFGWRWS